jgi:hypothetical protein
MSLAVCAMAMAGSVGGCSIGLRARSTEPFAWKTDFSTPKRVNLISIHCGEKVGPYRGSRTIGAKARDFISLKNQ